VFFENQNQRRFGGRRGEHQMVTVNSRRAEFSLQTRAGVTAQHQVAIGLRGRGPGRRRLLANEGEFEPKELATEEAAPLHDLARGQHSHQRVPTRCRPLCLALQGILLESPARGGGRQQLGV
jgi:hypothetical protein